jgi:hypothetical protein
LSRFIRFANGRELIERLTEERDSFILNGLEE